jgi:uncharacterized protein YndB with AHSA1/START domain
MTFQSDPNVIQWKIHLKSPPEEVYKALSTDQGRASFRAESAIEQDGIIDFVFPNHAEWKGKILDTVPSHKFKVEYYSDSVVTFELSPDGSGGTDLTLTDRGVPQEDREEVTAGWVSVLMAFKASVDFGVDLRNHDLKRTWDEGFAEN